MPTIISTKANEKSTYVVTCAFADEEGVAVIPSSIKWSLTNKTGVPINSRDQVDVAVPAASVDIVLSGDDLQILTSEASLSTVERRFIVEAVYDSDAGSDLPLNEEMVFLINNLTKIA